MIPAYDVDSITIYHADCADILPTIEPDSVDLLLTDPPYGIGYVGTPQTKARWGDDPLVVGDDDPFDPTYLLRYGRCVIWGAQNFAEKLPASPGWIVWAKIQTQHHIDSKGRFGKSPVELAWSNVANSPRLFNHFWGGSPLHRTTERGSSLHPTQKPVALMRWILEKWTEPGDLILDPYMGSGPVARACADLGRRYIGIEIVEEYVDAAINRLGQMALTLDGSG